MAVGTLMAVALQAQEGSASFDQLLQTNSFLRLTLKPKQEARVQLGSGVELTGLLVDWSKPQQTWTMLTTSAPAAEPTKTLPPSLLPIKAPVPISDKAVNHESSFVLLRFSFP